MIIKPDSTLDLVLERVVDVPSRLLWKGWTQPDYLKQWFTPVRKWVFTSAGAKRSISWWH